MGLEVNINIPIKPAYGVCLRKRGKHSNVRQNSLLPELVDRPPLYHFHIILHFPCYRPTFISLRIKLWSQLEVGVKACEPYAASYCDVMFQFLNF